MFKSLLITYGQDLTLEYRLRDYPIVQRWANELSEAQKVCSIDDPKRFYGFGSQENQIAIALAEVNKNISILKKYFKDLTGDYITDIRNRDLLNYWHHVFEVNHGLLDERVEGIPEDIRVVLGDLNVAIHRCEVVASGPQKFRHVVTYYSWPKTQQLEESDYQLFTQVWKPGTVFLNYVEIGKTLEHLSRDNDRYISDRAFRPYKHFSADFNVWFYEQTEEKAKIKNQKINDYYLKHIDFFGPWKPSYVGGMLPLADLVGSIDPTQLITRQHVTEVKLIQE